MTGTNVPTGLPFSLEEYRERATRVREEMEAHGVDVLCVTSPANILYLTGYEAAWYPPRLPVGVIIDRATPELTFLDWSRHVDYAERWALYDDCVLFEYSDWLEVLTGVFAERGWTSGTVGLEGSASNPTGGVLAELRDGLSAAGAEVVEGNWIVDSVRLWKTPAEVERVRRAAAIGDAAFSGLREQLRPGMTELEVAARLVLLQAEQGGEIAAMPPFVSSGPDAWRDTHAFPSNRRLEDGDTLAVDICAVVDRYHVNLSRSFAIGTPSASAQALLAANAGGVEQMVAGARLGDETQYALKKAEDYVLERISPDRIWWVGGYALGLGCPPSWVGHTYLANDGYEKITWKPGYLSNYETILFDRDEHYAALVIDSVLMTEDGLEVLSKLPRELLET